MSKLTIPLCVGTLLQILMVLVGHFVPAAQQLGLFPILGTLIGLVTGALTTPSASLVTTVARGGITGCLAGVVGSLVSNVLGDVPMVTVGIAASSTLVAGALGALGRRTLSGSRVQTPG